MACASCSKALSAGTASRYCSLQCRKRRNSRDHHKTPKGFIASAYRGARRRIEGRDKKNAHLYRGLPIMSREEFLDWSWNDTGFWRVFKNWSNMGHILSLAPSLNRINPELGYVAGNVEWVTQSVNSSLVRRPGRDAVTQAIKRAINAT